MTGSVLSGEPSFSALIEGSDEVDPGTDFLITILLENDATHKELIAPKNEDPDLPTTAIGLMVAAESGSAPVSISSGPFYAGDLAAGDQVRIPVNGTINISAPSSSAIIDLNLTYKIRYVREIMSQGMTAYRYLNKEVHIPILLDIQELVIPQVTLRSESRIAAGHEGYLDLLVTNMGSGSGTDSTIVILKDSGSPVRPLESEFFVNRIVPGEEIPISCRVYVERSAREGIYPVNLLIQYQDNDGKWRESRHAIFGVLVSDRLSFSLLSEPVVIHPGEEQTIHIGITNNGNETAYGAIGRLSVMSPFSLSSDTSSLGDLKPGSSSDAKFVISADSHAVIKEYGLSLEVRYHDRLGNVRLSDLMLVPVEVIPRTGLDAIIHNPILLAIISGIILIISYLVWKKRRS